MKYWFLFSHGNIVLSAQADGSFAIPLQDNPPFNSFDSEMHVPAFGNQDAVIADIGDLPLPQGFQSIGLRASYYKLDHESYLLAGKAAELLDWHKSTHYCGCCGHPLSFHTPISKLCPNCHREIWPKLSPAVIVLIRRADEVLLVQSRSFKKDYYGLVAGFVETGESLEEAVHREVREETGLEIDGLRYFGSQPWPYPRGLMIGFTANYVSGNLHIQFSELNKGGWYKRETLPAIPEKLSIARMLIDAWIEGRV